MADIIKKMLEVVKILKVEEECRDVKTLTLNKKIEAEPGQFCMLWIPDVGEKPFSPSGLKGHVKFMVRDVGPFTTKLCSLKEDDRVGIRGPYGDGSFTLKGKTICIAAGGVGIAPLIPLLEEAIKSEINATVIHGARTKKELIPLERFKDDAEVIHTTDDGTCGDRGSVCDALNRMIKDRKFDAIYTCGPEQMMKAVAGTARNNKIFCQISMERYIKCGIGVCGQCAIDPKGLLICKDGPVFNAEELGDSELGRYKRDASGSRIDL